MTVRGRIWGAEGRGGEGRGGDVASAAGYRACVAETAERGERRTELLPLASWCARGHTVFLAEGWVGERADGRTVEGRKADTVSALEMMLG
jgi:hypothetical protein